MADLTVITSSLASQLDPENEFRHLYRRAAKRQWLPDEVIDWTLPSEVDPSIRQPWLKLLNVFFTMETIGHIVIINMMNRVPARLHDHNLRYYLSLQCADEARHTSVLEDYIQKSGQI